MKENKLNTKSILNRVGKALDYQFEIYPWEHMLKDCGLTEEELTWAKEHLCYKVEHLCYKVYIIK
jgi:hypothetical protein